MSDESFQEKTEAPTPKRREDARKKGQLPRSQELTTAFLLIMAGLAIQVGGSAFGATMVRLFRAITARAAIPAVSPDATALWVGGVGWTVLAGLAPIVLTFAGTALLIGGIQAQGVLTLEPLKPKGDKINPLKRAKEIWGAKALHELMKSLLKLLIVGVAVYMALSRAMDEFPALAQQSPMAMMLLIRTYVVRVFLTAGVAYLALAALDYAFQRWQHEKKLRMTKEEVKREHKETDGDPHVKARRRTMARSLARRRMILSVSEADVVITNPTHIAVALKYDIGVAPAPIVLAMGTRKLAERIKAKARESGVPMVENKPLARSLLASAKVGMPIPVELYVAVAEILAWVIKNRPRRPTAWQGSSTV